MQRPPPQTHLHVPGAPAVLPVLVGSGWVELRVPEVSEEQETV